MEWRFKEIEEKKYIPREIKHDKKNWNKLNGTEAKREKHRCKYVQRVNNTPNWKIKITI